MTRSPIPAPTGAASLAGAAPPARLATPLLDPVRIPADLRNL